MLDFFSAGVALVGIVLAIVWIAFPVIVIAKLNAQQKTLAHIERNTKAQADFWNNRNVKIN